MRQLERIHCRTGITFATDNSAEYIDPSGRIQMTEVKHQPAILAIYAPSGYDHQAMKQTNKALIRAYFTLIVILSLLATAAPALAQTVLPPTQTPAPVTLPTATATIVGGPTSTPTRTPTPVPVLAEMLGDPTNLRSGPGLDFDIVAELAIGTQLPIIGRSVTLPWYVVASPDVPGGEAWVYEQLVRVIGDITTVPVVEPPAAPTPNSQEQAAMATESILLLTPGAIETATAVAGAFPTGVFTQTPAGLTIAGQLPTFTPVEPYIQPSAIPPLKPTDRSGGIPPAVIIIVCGVMGLLSIVLGLLRKL